MGKAIVVVLPDEDADAIDAITYVIQEQVRSYAIDGRRVGMEAVVIGWPPDMGEITELLDAT